VAAEPESTEAWLQLAERQLELDQAAAAERSLWTAIELGDPDGLAHARLGFLLYAQHRDDEALVLLEAAREREASLPLLEHTLTVLQARARAEEASVAAPSDDRPSEVPLPEPRERPPEPRPDAGAPRDGGPRPEPGPEPLVADAPGGPCDLPLERIDGGRTFVLGVDIDGVAARLIVDTGASLTVLTRELASELGVGLDAQHGITAITANGRVEMPTAVLPHVAVGERVVRELRVAVCDDCVSDLADGLLGLDLQTTLGMQIDAGASVLRFGDCAL
jgi:clan AA aspartic protease (TIGR02281 family)